MAYRIQYRRATAAVATANNVVLAAGEPGLETDTGKVKVGDGITAWNALAYEPSTGSVATAKGEAIAAAAIDATDKVAAVTVTTLGAITPDGVDTKISDERVSERAHQNYTFGLLSPQGSTALRTFKAALASARAGIGACDILTIGDSIAEGTGPTTIGGRWASRFRDNLRAKSGIVGGRGYVPAVYAVPGASQPFVLSGGASNFQLNYGLGRRAARMNGAGHTITLTVPIGHTDVDLVMTASTAAWGWFSYTVDGGAGIPASPVATAPLATAILRDIVIPIATGLDPATTHSIVLVWGGSGNIYLTGAMLYNADKTTGIRLWDGAHHGQASNYFSTAADPWNYTVNTVQPDLVCIMLGRNDWSAGAQTPAQVRTNLEALIANLRAQCTIAPSIVLIATYGNVQAGAAVAPWSDYVDAMKALAVADGDVAVLDLVKRLGTINTAGTNGLGILIGDLTHPTDLGSQMISDALMDFVSYPITA